MAGIGGRYAQMSDLQLLFFINGEGNRASNKVCAFLLFNSVHTLSTCSFLVSGFLTEMTQQIHSLRASGVMSSHCFRAAGSETRAFRKSAGTLWTTPAESFLVMALLYAWSLTAVQGGQADQSLPVSQRSPW